MPQLGLENGSERALEARLNVHNVGTQVVSREQRTPSCSALAIPRDSQQLSDSQAPTDLALEEVAFEDPCRKKMP